MRRDIFTSEHDDFREMVRAFIAKEVTPYHDKWEADQMVSRDVWLAAGRAGLLGIEIDEKYGGGGSKDYRYYLILDEELARAGANGPGFAVHNDINGPYLQRLATPEQCERWLPGYCTGELITAIAMTEPGAGSDLQGMRTTAVRDGGHYVLNGSKTFISNGQLCDLVIVAARTDPEAGYRGISLLSEEGGGFVALMQNLPRERLAIGATALAGAEEVFATTLAYCKEREAFGRPIGKFQHNRFVLAEIATEVAVARAFTDKAVLEHNAGNLSVADAAMVKWWNTELCNRVVDRCVQLHGGYGYMREFPVARAFTDSRAQTIFGGTTEIMKEIIGRDLGL